MYFVDISFLPLHGPINISGNKQSFSLDIERKKLRSYTVTPSQSHQTFLITTYTESVHPMNLAQNIDTNLIAYQSRS